MKKKSLLTLLATTTAFSGVAIVSQPSDTEAASIAKTQVTKAEKLAQKLAAEINYDKRKKQYPKSPVGLPNAKIYKDTKTAYSQALAAVKKAKGSEKKVLQARLDSKVKPTIDRTATYIAAVNAGAKLLTASYALDKNVKAYKLDSKTEKNYELLSADYAKLTKQINSVYGSSTRISLNKAYMYKIAPIYKQARFAFNFQSNLGELAQAIKAGDQVKAQTCVDLADKLIADNQKYKYANVTTALYKQLMAAYRPLAVPTLSLKSVTATLSSGVTASDSNNTVTLSAASNVQLSSLTLESNFDGFTAKIVSIDGYPVNKSFTDGIGDGNASITLSPNRLLPVPLQDGISLDTLKSVFGQEATIVVDLSKDGATSVTKTITVNLNVTEANPWFDLTRLADNNIQVTLKQPTSKITDMYNNNNMDELEFLNSIVLPYMVLGNASVKLVDASGNTVVDYQDSSLYSNTQIKNWLGISTGNETIAQLDGKKIYVKDDKGTERIITLVTQK